MASDHLRSGAGSGIYSEMAIRALPFGGYVVYAASPHGLGERAAFTEFLAAFGDLTAALAFIEQHILRNPAQESKAA